MVFYHKKGEILSAIFIQKPTFVAWDSGVLSLLNSAKNIQSTFLCVQLPWFSFVSRNNTDFFPERKVVDPIPLDVVGYYRFVYFAFDYDFLASIQPKWTVHFSSIYFSTSRRDPSQSDYTPEVIFWCLIYF